MQSGGLVQLAAYGAQDIYLTGNPKITFFRYPSHTTPFYNDDSDYDNSDVEPEVLHTDTVTETVHDELEVLHTDIEYMHDETDDGFDLKFSMGTILDICNDNIGNLCI